MSDLANTYVYPVATIDGYTQTGITLRQHYAGLAMQGLIANKAHPTHFNPSDDASYVLAITDALIAALSQSPTAKE